MPSSPISPCPSCPPHAAGGHGCAVYSSSVTDAQWAILEPLLAAPGSTAGRGGRPEKHCRRAIVDAILYIAGGGIPWRQLPMEFPPAATMSAVFAGWARSGAWQRILDALRDRLRVRAGRDRCPTAAIIDSQTVPAADTVPRSSSGWDGGTRTNGVTRHLAVDVNGLLLTVVVTAASTQTATPHTDSWPHCAAASPPSGWSGPPFREVLDVSAGRKPAGRHLNDVADIDRLLGSPRTLRLKVDVGVRQTDAWRHQLVVTGRQQLVGSHSADIAGILRVRDGIWWGGVVVRDHLATVTVRGVAVVWLLRGHRMAHPERLSASRSGYTPA
jgi:transposase